MSRTKKVAVTIDSEVLATAERLRQKTGESRSALVNRALRLVVEDEKRHQRVERYVAAYRERPESADDVELAAQLANESLAGLPW